MSAEAKIPLLRVRDAEVWVPHAGGRTHLLRELDWTPRAAERWALLGHNGAGKSTLLSLVGAVRHPSGGAIEVLGHRLGRVDVRELRSYVGHVDAGALVPGDLTVFEYVLTGATGSVHLLHDRIADADRKRADEVIGLLRLGDLADRTVGVCSQGERGRARIARALMPDPRLLLLDEPTAALDLPSRKELLDAIDLLTEEIADLGLVLLTHHLEELPSCLTHALVLRGGRGVAYGPVDEVLTSETLTRAYGVPLTVRYEDGRWSARSTRRRSAR